MCGLTSVPLKHMAMDLVNWILLVLITNGLCYRLKYSNTLINLDPANVVREIYNVVYNLQLIFFVLEVSMCS